MVEQLHIGILAKNTLSIVFGKAHLHIEIWGGDELINFRVAGVSVGNSVEVDVNEDYNKRKAGIKAVNFIVRQKNKE